MLDSHVSWWISATDVCHCWQWQCYKNRTDGTESYLVDVAESRSTFVVYRVPATGSPIPKERVPAGAMIGWHVARHWAAGDICPCCLQASTVKMASTL